MHISGTRLIAATLLALALTSCGSEDKEPSEPEKVPLGTLMAKESQAERHARCPSAWSPTGCYKPSLYGIYCRVVRIREVFQSGAFRLSDLPGWTDKTVRSDGAPQIFDFRSGEHRLESYKYRARLDRWVERQRLDINNGVLGGEGLPSQSEIEKTEGGPYPNFDPAELVPSDFLVPKDSMGNPIKESPPQGA